MATTCTPLPRSTRHTARWLLAGAAVLAAVGTEYHSPSVVPTPAPITSTAPAYTPRSADPWWDALTPCELEDGSGQAQVLPCYWDGGANQVGDTYVVMPDGYVLYLTREV